MSNMILFSLKNKKNFFILILALTVVIGIILPLLFDTVYDLFVMMALIISVIVILVSSFIDFSFMHDDRKLTYYLSKPHSLTEKLTTTLISNLIFNIITFIIVFLISCFAASIFESESFFIYINDSNLIYFSQVLFAWLVIMTVISGLASELSGNTIIAAAVSIFIFCLPLIAYLISNYIFIILEKVSIGFSIEMLSSLFLDKLLPLDKIYFLNYVDKFADFMYFVQLIFVICALYALNILFAKRRKNEYTDNFIVHTGFKYFVAVLASVIVPMFLSLLMFNNNLGAEILILVILSSLSYYVIISVLDKSFRISKMSLKVYFPFILILVVSISAFSFIIKDQDRIIPQHEDVKAVVLDADLTYHENCTLMNEEKHRFDTVTRYNESSYDNIKDNDDVMMFEDKDNIQNIIDIQKSLIEYYTTDEQSYSYGKLNFIYYMENGKKIIRSYPLSNLMRIDNTDKQLKNIRMEFAKLLSSDEFINERFKGFVYEEFVNKYETTAAVITTRDELYEIDKFEYKNFAKAYIEDYKDIVKTDDFLRRMDLYALFGNQLGSILTYDDGNIEEGAADTTVLAEENPMNTNEEYGIEFIYEFNKEYNPSRITSIVFYAKDMPKTTKLLIETIENNKAEKIK